MSISVFPAPVASSVNANSITAAAPNTVYSIVRTFETGTYTITCVNTTIANVTFMNGTSLLLDTVTISGTVTVVLGTPATSMRVFTNTGTDIPITCPLYISYAADDKRGVVIMWRRMRKKKKK